MIFFHLNSFQQLLKVVRLTLSNKCFSLICLVKLVIKCLKSFFRRMFFSVGFLINRSSESPVSGSTVPDFFFAKIVFEPFDPGKRLASVMYKILIFYPIWAYWAYFAPVSICFFLFLSQHKVRDTPPRGTWLWTIHWWRQVGKDRKNK